MIHQQISILLVVLPLLAAPTIVILNHRKLAWLISTLVIWACFAMAVVLLSDVASGEVIHYELGGWAAPWGIEYKVDALNALITLIICGIGALTSLYAYRSVEDEIPDHLIPLFYAAFLLCFLGLLGMTLTGDIFNLFVFLEVSSLATYAMIALGRKRKCLTAAFNYLMLGTLGATFFLIGVGFLYAATGTLNMDQLLLKLPEVENMQLVHTAFAMIVVGIALKAAIYPLHLWLPNAYTQAPSVVSVFLSATATKVAIYALIRCMFNVYDLEYILASLLPQGLILLGAVAILYGSVQAIWQTNMKRLLAYSSVAQIGYMIMGVGFVSHQGLTASLIHLFNHGLMKAVLFMAAGLFIYRVNTTALSSLKGMGREMPWTFAAMMLGALSLIGVPGTVGFVSKWQLIQAALNDGQWAMVFVILIGSLLAIVYLWKLVEVLYFQSSEKVRVPRVSSGDETVARSPATMMIATWILALACIYFGINTDLTIGTAQTAVELLINGRGVTP